MYSCDNFIFHVSQVFFNYFCFNFKYFTGCFKIFEIRCSTGSIKNSSQKLWKNYSKPNNCSNGSWQQSEVKHYVLSCWICWNIQSKSWIPSYCIKTFINFRLILDFSLSSESIFKSRFNRWSFDSIISKWITILSGIANHIYIACHNNGYKSWMGYLYDIN